MVLNFHFPRVSYLSCQEGGRKFFNLYHAMFPPRYPVVPYGTQVNEVRVEWWPTSWDHSWLWLNRGTHENYQIKKPHLFLCFSCFILRSDFSFQDPVKIRLSGY